MPSRGAHALKLASRTDSPNVDRYAVDEIFRKDKREEKDKETDKQR